MSEKRVEIKIESTADTKGFDEASTALRELGAAEEILGKKAAAAAAEATTQAEAMEEFEKQIIAVRDSLKLEIEAQGLSADEAEKAVSVYNDLAEALKKVAESPDMNPEVALGFLQEAENLRVEINAYADAVLEAKAAVEAAAAAEAAAAEKRDAIIDQLIEAAEAQAVGVTKAGDATATAGDKAAGAGGKFKITGEQARMMATAVAGIAIQASQGAGALELMSVATNSVAVMLSATGPMGIAAAAAVTVIGDVAKNYVKVGEEAKKLEKDRIEESFKRAKDEAKKYLDQLTAMDAGKLAPLKKELESLTTEWVTVTTRAREYYALQDARQEVVRKMQDAAQAAGQKADRNDLDHAVKGTFRDTPEERAALEARQKRDRLRVEEERAQADTATKIDRLTTELGVLNDGLERARESVANNKDALATATSDRASLLDRARESGLKSDQQIDDERLRLLAKQIKAATEGEIRHGNAGTAEGAFMASQLRSELEKLKGEYQKLVTFRSERDKALASGEGLTWDTAKKDPARERDVSILEALIKGTYQREADAQKNIKDSNSGVQDMTEQQKRKAFELETEKQNQTLQRNLSKDRIDDADNEVSKAESAARDAMDKAKAEAKAKVDAANKAATEAVSEVTEKTTELQGKLEGLADKAAEGNKEVGAAIDRLADGLKDGLQAGELERIQAALSQYQQSVNTQFAAMATTAQSLAGSIQGLIPQVADAKRTAENVAAEVARMR